MKKEIKDMNKEEYKNFLNKSSPKELLSSLKSNPKELLEDMKNFVKNYLIILGNYANLLHLHIAAHMKGRQTRNVLPVGHNKR